MRPAITRDKLARTAPVFAALGDETRLGIIAALCTQGPQSIARLTEGTDVTRQAVTKHLELLEQAGVIRSERDGRERIWSVEPQRLGEAQRYLDLISQQWDRALERLRAMVEDD
ncbi:MAG: metalloregulator ArsR/SmtB family transcription factor [Kofleriaceae bacterium]